MQTKSRHKRVLIIPFLLFAAVTLACGTLVNNNPPVPAATLEPAITVSAQTPSSIMLPQIASEDQVLVDLYTRVNPSVVNITIYVRNNGQVIPLGQGSGFVYDDGGDILTNAHVVHGADQIEVTFHDGLIRPAELIGEDLHSDLAIINVDLPEGIQPLPLGNMDNLAVGQTVVAIGNPFGHSGTLTRGIISALGRTIPALTVFSIPQAIQTDASINPGNSGGPLLNLNGEVIGVNAQIETDGTSTSNSGVGFAIPVSIINRVAPSLVEKGAYLWAWLGVGGDDVDPLLVQAMDLSVEQGAYIAEIIPGGPSSKAGLRGASDTVTIDGRSVMIGGDVITGIDGQTVKTFNDVLIYIALHTSPGQQVVLTILRDGELMELTVTLEPRPAE